MIDPVIFSFKLFNLEIVLRWYGVLVMFGAVVGAWWAEREIRRRGENGEVIWDAMVWVLPIGIVGARLWYVVNNIFSGATFYLENPIHILYVWEGGLHFFGGLLFGGLALIFFLRQNGMDVWLFLDALAPATLLGQALARPANFINQELYGQPTQLPWGIPIEASHRLAQYSDLTQFPVETTRFHPTFAYEMVLNFLIVLFLWWLSRRYEKDLKPGTLFSAWLVFAGLSRTFIEFFRPDQARIGGTFISYTMAVSFAMAVAGVILLLVRLGKIKFAPLEGWEDEYQVNKVDSKAKSSANETSFVEDISDMDEAEVIDPVPANVEDTSDMDEAEVMVPISANMEDTSDMDEAEVIVPVPAKKKPAVKVTARKATAEKVPAEKASAKKKAPVKKVTTKKVSTIKKKAPAATSAKGKKAPAAKKPAPKRKKSEE